MGLFKNEIEAELFDIRRNDVSPIIDVLVSRGSYKLRHGIIVPLNDNGSESVIAPLEPFTYTFTNVFFTRFTSRINTKIHRTNYSANTFHYLHLNAWQRIKLSWMFGNTFFQKHENIKWILGMIFTFIIGYILAKIKCAC